MNNERGQYQKILSKKKGIEKEIAKLRENEAVKRYIDLSNQNEGIDKQLNDLFLRIKKDEYSSCNHIWVKVLHESDNREGRSYEYFGCMKCGLDQRVILKRRDDLTLDQKVMYKVLNEHNYQFGIYAKTVCDFDLAKAIYAKIKKAHPNIDDETARKFFEIALTNIRKNKISDQRKASRAKRLSLKPEFKHWTGMNDIFY